MRAWVPWARPQGDDDAEANSNSSRSDDPWTPPARVEPGERATATFTAVLPAPGDVLPVGAPTVQMPQWRAANPKASTSDDDDPTTIERAHKPQLAPNVDTVPLSVKDIRAHLASRRSSTEK